MKIGVTMKKHTKIYTSFFGYISPSEIPCEICTAPAVDIHHIEPRGMGGSKLKDFIENLMGLCRNCHDDAEGHVYTKEELVAIHLNFIINNRPDYVLQYYGYNRP